MTSSGFARWCARACYQAGVAFLFLAVIALSIQAKDSRYLPASNPARHVSKLGRMEETSTQHEGVRAAFVRCGRIPPGTHQRVAEKPALPLAWVEVLRLRLSAFSNAEQLRSPPASLV
ncbi:MAG: hypothetical protein LAP13_00135 [Acidobacteriia bacterium]|nr:hypothetical protein [Terriglobia bacterium]